ARTWALLVALGTLLVAALLIPKFDFNQTTTSLDKTVQIRFGFSPDNPFSVATPINFAFRLGADTISLWLVLLTAFIQPLAIASSFESIKERAKEYYAWMSLLLMAMLGCFIARDL